MSEGLGEATTRYVRAKTRKDTLDEAWRVVRERSPKEASRFFQEEATMANSTCQHARKKLKEVIDG